MHEVLAGSWRQLRKPVTVPTSPADVQAMFVGFDDDQPQVHEVDSLTGSSRVFEMFRRTVKDVIVVSGTLIIRVLRLETLAGFVGTAATAICFEELSDMWKTAVASLGIPADPFCFEKWSKSKSKSKETSRGILLRKLAAQSETTPEEPSLDELEGFVTLVRREKSLQRRGKVPRWVAGQSASRSQQFLENVTELNIV